jgi:uncharacterized membrane protein HdeD (DUF308 family)
LEMILMAEMGSYIGDWKGRLVLGIIMLIFGFMFLLVPGFTLTLFIYLFGILMIVIGIVLIVFSLDRTAPRNWRILNILEGLLALMIGIIALVWPDITALWAIFLVGLFAVFSGSMQIAEGLVTGRRTVGCWSCRGYGRSSLAPCSCCIRDRGHSL